MEKVKITDAGGNTIIYLKFKNEDKLQCPLLDKMEFDLIKRVPIRDDDVILCSWPRSGTHWAWEWIRLIQTGKAEIDAADKDVAMFEFYHHGELDSQPSPRALNSHMWFTQLPAQVAEKKTPIVVMYRNPKDSCVSWYVHHREFPVYEYRGEFKHWIQLFLDGKVDWGAYSDYLREWERVIEAYPDHPIHVMNYEDMTKDPVKELTKLSQFLGKESDVSFLQEVGDACAFSNMRSKKGHNWDKWNVPDSYSSIYRKGKVGGWKDWFTVAQSEDFDRQWSNATAGLKIFTFS